MLSSFTLRLEGQTSFSPSPSPSPSPVPASCHSSLATAPASPFPANLSLIALAKGAAPPQLAENTAALSPASTNLDAASSLTPLFATLTKNTPGGAARFRPIPLSNSCSFLPSTTRRRFKAGSCKLQHGDLRTCLVSRDGFKMKSSGEREHRGIFRKD